MIPEMDGYLVFLSSTIKSRVGVAEMSVMNIEIP